MLELRNLIKDKISIVSQKEQKKQNILMSIKQHRGHTLFEINKNTGEISKAEYLHIEAHFDDKLNKTTHKKVRMKKDCYYVSALNKKNVIKKILEL